MTAVAEFELGEQQPRVNTEVLESWYAPSSLSQMTKSTDVEQEFLWYLWANKNWITVIKYLLEHINQYLRLPCDIFRLSFIFIFIKAGCNTNYNDLDLDKQSLS